MTELGLRTIPGYTVHELLERDLVSATYLAERQSDGYPVFLQVVSDEFDDFASADAFTDALERMARIKHPALPDVLDIGRASGLLFCVTTAVEGRSLAATLARSGRLPPDEALAACVELADTLDTLHTADVVHGAISPHTVWINDRSRAPSAPRVTLRGFGTTPLLSQRVSADRPDPPPADLLYVAPEQIRRGEISGRVDQYALACMVVHCLTGAPPFERATVNALLGAHLFAAPRPQGLPEHVTTAVQRAMSKDPADRYVLCNAFVTAIGGDADRSWNWMIEEALDVEIEQASGDDTEALEAAAAERAVEEAAIWLDVETSIQALVDRSKRSTGNGAESAGPAAGAVGSAAETAAAGSRADAGGDVADRGAGAAAQDTAPFHALTAAAFPATTGRRPADGAPARPTNGSATRVGGITAPDGAAPGNGGGHGGAQRSGGHSGLGGGRDDDHARRSGDEAEPAPGPLTQRRAANREVTIRSLSEADWLPGNSGAPGATDRAGAPPRPPKEAAPDRQRGVDRQVLRWITVALVTLFMVATIVLLVLRGSGGQPDPATDAVVERAERAPTTTNVWQHSVTGPGVTTLLVTATTVLGSADTTLYALRPATGESVWDAHVADPVVEVAAIDGVVVTRTPAALHAFDERTGRTLWETTRDPLPPAAMAAGATTLYEVAADGEALHVRARAPATGEVQWTLDALTATGEGTRAVYDATRHGDGMLYVLAGSRLHALDTATRRTRWRTDLDAPQPASLTATAGAILVIDGQGRICRYGMRDGDEVWTECAALERGPGPDTSLATRNGRVIVRSHDEVTAVDFTSGTAHWHVTDAAGFQDAFAADAEMAYLAHADGSIEAIDHQRGVERWRSQPLGDLTAMAAAGGVLYVATGAGDITRLEPAATTP